jgi:hypothetical protein
MSRALTWMRVINILVLLWALPDFPLFVLVVVLAVVLLLFAPGVRLLQSLTTSDPRTLAIFAFSVLFAKLTQTPGFIALIAALIPALALIYFLALTETAQGYEKATAKTILRMSSLSLPVALILFLVFPKISTNFSGGGAISRVAATGFSGELNPGEFEQITLDATPVLRAKLSSQIDSNQLYWRGQVLERPAGFGWRSRSLGERSDVQFSGEPIEVQWVQEPGEGTMAFVLEWSSNVTSGDLGVLSQHGQFLIPDQQGQRLEMRGKFWPNAHLVRNDLRPPFLDVGKEATEKMRGTVKHILGDARSAEQKVVRILNYFAENEFKYSLEPGSLKTLSSFLAAKKGFCEHYASATALFLRMAGVPANVVVGYQGGVYNDFGDYWTISNQDAHAWVEYLDERNHWRRVDPTSVVAPERAQLGGRFFRELLGSKSALEIQKVWARFRGESKGLGRWLLALESFADYVRYRWNHLVMVTDVRKRFEFLGNFKELGINPDIAQGLAALFLALFAGGLLRRLFLNPAEKAADFEIVEKYKKLIQPFEVAVPRAPQETPREYSERVIRHLKAHDDRAAPTAPPPSRVGDTLSRKLFSQKGPKAPSSLDTDILRLRNITAEYEAARFGGDAEAADRLRRISESIRKPYFR